MTQSINAIDQPPFLQKTYGLFYRIKDADGVTRGYIWGTMHNFQLWDFKPVFDDKINRCFNKCKALVVECDALKEAERQLTALKKDVDPKEFLIAVKKSAEENQMMDLNLLIQAREEKKDIHELEDVEFLNEMQGESLQEISKNFWRITRKDHDERDKLPREIFSEGSEEKALKFAKFGMSEEFCLRFYDERNEKMAEKIDALLHKEEGRFFIAIGAGHVSGKAGVPVLLSKNWHIEKMPALR